MIGYIPHVKSAGPRFGVASILQNGYENQQFRKEFPRDRIVWLANKDTIHVYKMWGTIYV